MPGVCLLNYFFETTSFSFGWSDDQPLTLTTAHESFVGNSDPHWRPIRDWPTHTQALAPQLLRRLPSPHWALLLSPPATSGSLGAPKCRLISCSVLLRRLFFLSSLRPPEFLIWSKFLNSNSGFPPFLCSCALYAVLSFCLHLWTLKSLRVGAI